MSISFPAIASEWVALDSLSVSLRDTAFCDQRVESIAKPDKGVNPIFKWTPPVLLSSHRWFGVDAVE